MKIVLIFALIVVIAASGCAQTGGQPGSPNPYQPAPSSPTNQLPVQPGIDSGQVGSLNHGYLQPQPYQKIIVEIDFSSRQPADSTKSALVKFFQTAANKPVIFSGSNLITTGKNIYAAEDLRQAEKANRQHYTSGDTAVVYIMLLDGQYESGSALGIAYSASSFALFPDRISDSTSALVLYSQIEEAVAVHELGHLMGLVNLNYQSERTHEDTEHKGHSRNRDSVMFWAVEDISLKTLLNFGPPRDFDADDLFDLQKMRDGVY